MNKIDQLRKELKDQFNCVDENPIMSFDGNYRFLSNFWVAEFTLRGNRYKTSEHAFMEEKTLNLEHRQMIRECISAAKAKQFCKPGGIITLRDDWEDVKFTAMYDAVYAKFSQNEYLKKALLDTGFRYLEEGNHWKDTVWGVCQEAGLNALGQIQMLVRQQLREQQ